MSIDEDHPAKVSEVTSPSDASNSSSSGKNTTNELISQSPLSPPGNNVKNLPHEKLENTGDQIYTNTAATENAAKDVETDSRHRPSGSIKSTNSSISGSSKTASEAFTNQSNLKSTINSKHNSKKGDEVSSANSKNRVGNSPRHSKLHIAECPVEVATTGLYNSNINDSTNIDAEESADLTGLMNMGDRNHRKYSITSIAAAAVAPIIGVYNANPQVTSIPGNDAMTARKKSTDESMNKVHNLPQLKLNSDKGQQGKPGITLTSTTSSNKDLLTYPQLRPILMVLKSPLPTTIM